MRRLLLALAATGLVALAAGPGSASAATHTQSYKVPVELGAFKVRQTLSFVPKPNVDGHITAMSADVVDANDKAVPIQRLMLHHIVFFAINQGNPACTSFTGYDSRPYKIGASGQPFFGNGEERNALVLPKGYGYKVSQDHLPWAMVWMLMNHRGVTDHAFIRYTVTWDDSPGIKEVKPYWLDVRNCNADPVYSVAGGRKPGSTNTQTYDYRMPESGRIVAGGGHVHGGAKNLTVSEPDCSNRTVFKSKPAWGMPDHPFYNVRPILHDPGPISMSGMLSKTGYPIAKGQRVRLTSNYDAERPHMRVMGISMIYVAPDPSVKGCAKPPTDMVNIQPAKLRGEPFRTEPPVFTVPLTGIDDNGKPQTIDKPPGKRVRVPDGAAIKVGDHYFGPPNVSVANDSTLRWSFGPSTLHNVTLANGPRGFASPNLSDNRQFKYRFRVPGTYRIFCALHPVQMTATVLVRKPAR